MPEYIDRNQLLEHIKGLPTWWVDTVGVYEKTLKYPDGVFDPEDVIASIENAPAVKIEPVYKWISVDDRLPEIKEHYCSETVLVYLNDGGYAFTGLEQTAFGDFVFGIDRVSASHGDDETYVTHWMPLPGPPGKPEEDEGK